MAKEKTEQENTNLQLSQFPRSKESNYNTLISLIELDWHCSMNAREKASSIQQDRVRALKTNLYPIDTRLESLDEQKATGPFRGISV